MPIVENWKSVDINNPELEGEYIDEQMCPGCGEEGGVHEQELDAPAARYGHVYEGNLYAVACARCYQRTGNGTWTLRVKDGAFVVDEG